jgi:glutamine synthetase
MPRPGAWAHENRTTALRVPSGGPAARRIEHRVAGGDINPYLFLAAILGAALNGLEDHDPPPPITGNAYDQDLTQLPNLGGAIDAFAAAPQIKRIFSPGPDRQHARHQAAGTALHGRGVRDERRELYLDTV